MDQNPPTIASSPSPRFEALTPADDQRSPGLPNRDTEHATLRWTTMKPPTNSEWGVIERFGRYSNFNPNVGKLSKRLSLQIADLRVATQIIVAYHYLHRGRTMAQLPYWINIDRVPVGVMLFSLPRLSVPLDGIPPMNVLELARLWISPDVQNHSTTDTNGTAHSLGVATCAIGAALRTVQKDWRLRYPNMPDIRAVVSWADSVQHEGTIYRAANFKEMGTSGGSLHGRASRSNGGRDQANEDYLNRKARFLYKFKERAAHVPPTQPPLLSTKDTG